jgi:hypothetical protein
MSNIAFVVYCAHTKTVKRSGSCQAHMLIEQAGPDEIVDYHDTVIEPNGRRMDVDGSLHPECKGAPPGDESCGRPAPPDEWADDIGHLDDDAVKVLKDTIADWEKIAAGTKVLRGPGNCPLCKLYYDDRCDGCPIKKKTGRALCAGHIFWEFIVATKKTRRQEGVARVTDERGKLAALACRDFLIGLLPVGEP